MKKTFKIIMILAIIAMLALPMSIVYADSLNSITANTSKTLIRPGEEVTVTIEFGVGLGSYTFDIAYDNNIFEYVSASEGTPSDDSTKVRVVFHDSSGGSNPSESLKVVFKAKDGITTSNPTEFSITAEGLANSDNSVNYDDITTPIVKNVTVEPEYQDYQFALNYTGDIYAGEEKEMTLSYSSSMGRYYEKARLIAEATTPDDATVSLIGTDEYDGEENIIQSGWGDPQGYEIGGKDVAQNLNVKALFSKIGNYTITLKLIDRSNSDTVIAEKEFSFEVKEKPVVDTTPDETDPETTPEETPETTPEEIPEEVVDDTTTTTEETTKEGATDTEKEEKPTTLPKTGYNKYLIALGIVLAIVSFAIYYNKKYNKTV